MKILLLVFCIIPVVSAAQEQKKLSGRQEACQQEQAGTEGLENIKALSIFHEPVIIAGTVTERGTGLPARGVIVRWKGTSHSVVTGWDGSYRIVALPGSRKLVFSKPGWKVRTIRIRFRRIVDISLVRKQMPSLPGQPEEDLPPDSLTLSFN
jgi:hypothetical protein